MMPAIAELERIRKWHSAGLYVDHDVLANTGWLLTEIDWLLAEVTRLRHRPSAPSLVDAVNDLLDNCRSQEHPKAHGECVHTRVVRTALALDAADVPAASGGVEKS